MSGICEPQAMMLVLHHFGPGRLLWGSDFPVSSLRGKAVTVGWRIHLGGLHLRYRVDPDMAIFAKALGNGFPIGAVIGRKWAMEGAHRSFISSTYWSESIGPVAAVATLGEMKKLDLPGRLAETGSKVQQRWRELGQKWGLPIEVTGFPCLWPGFDLFIRRASACAPCLPG